MHVTHMEFSYERVIRPLLFLLDAELVHLLSVWGIKIAYDLVLPRIILSSLLTVRHSCLSFRFNDVYFPNPVGLAAGYDKNGILVPAVESMGFGFIEIGSVTALPSIGNPRPRLARLARHEALINRMGLNNQGVDRVAARLSRSKNSLGLPLMVSIAKTNDVRIHGNKAILDYCYSFQRVYPIADLVILNISCPNTKDGKTFEDPNHLESLLSRILMVRDDVMMEFQMRNDVPILVKVGANVNSSTLKRLIDVCLSNEIKGMELTNTYPIKSENILRNFGIPSGGLSGKPLLKRSLQLVREASSLVGDDFLIVGVGGITRPVDALKMFQHGAHLVQVLTGLIYKGPMLPKKINNIIIQVCQEQGLRNFREFLEFLRFNKV